MTREKFLFHSCWLDIVKEIPMESQALALLAVIDYGVHGTLRNYNNPYVRALLAAAKPVIDRDDKKSKAQYKNGMKGGSKNGVSNNPNGRSKRVKTPAGQSPFRFIPPTLEEVRSYIDENELSVDAESFFYYYESNGWMVGRVSMKNWKSSLSKWHNDQKVKNKVNNDATKPYRQTMPV